MTEQSVIVVGAGLAGLACAFDLARAGVAVTTLERSDHAGGVVGTLSSDGFRFETGPNTVQASSEEFRNLCGDLGIADRLVASSPSAGARYLWLEDRLVALPSSIPGFLTTPVLSVGGKLRVASELLRRFRLPANGVEPSLRDFFSERLGPEAATRLAGAFVRGVYAAELDELGARSAFPRMWRACTEHGGLIRGVLAARKRAKPVLPGPACKPSDLLSFPGGLRELVDALAHAPRVNLVLGEEVRELARGPSGWSTRTSGGFALEATDVVLACPAPVAARLCARAGAANELTTTLERVSHANVTLVHLGFRASDVPSFPGGFGYLVPPDQVGGAAPRVLGTIFASSLFEGRAPEGCIAVTSFYRADTVNAWAAADVAREATLDFSRALRLPRTPEPIVARVLRWEGVIPRYAPGHRDRIDALETELARSAPGMHLAGSYTGGVSVEQVIGRGRAVARRILASNASTSSQELGAARSAPARGDTRADSNKERPARAVAAASSSARGGLLA
ncbi:MAG: protoporphyrinogen oxidase [Planctomycetes bacterium]|nr:protoporphyrinogen oxidase [Planctomycetota bacterium]